MKRRRPKGPAPEPKLAENVPAVIDEYVAFLRDSRPEDGADPKAFGARHAAAKAALTHLGELMRLSRGDTDSASEPETSLLEQLRQGMPPDESDDDGIG
ncbi:hypothetical protein [Roseococcus sp. YIM B11640]|uniref:hypothetical protein n=1 Tax=Roseococcus sp. YIM B11640 TaxID=3133973 RepID=UPI003C7B73B7